MDVNFIEPDCEQNSIFRGRGEYVTKIFKSPGTVLYQKIAIQFIINQYKENITFRSFVLSV